MVSFWPWKGDDSSPASFEKILSTLSSKISKKGSDLDSLRQRSRRLGLLWTLYTTFTYLLYSIILLLVVGWRNWGPTEIYFVRLGLLRYYSYRTSRVQSQLDELEKQRTSTIEKLKTATKYNSTQELLKKYGGTPSPKGKANGTPKQSSTNTPKSGRTNILPPPTANIPGRNIPASLPNTPQRLPPEAKSPLSQIVPHSAAAAAPPWQRPDSPQDISAEFAPNAFPSAPQYSQPGNGPRWYDRFVDALLGEDETLPKNRLALICSQCRLVNGQAPPGVKRLEDVGKWRCGGCGATNGEESEAKRIISSIHKQADSNRDHTTSSELSEGAKGSNMEEAKTDQISEDHESDITQYSDSGDEPDRASTSTGSHSKPIPQETPRRRSTRAQKVNRET
ncbi:MAG: hypothetical protein Q9191_004228 [Dirinaria sp. TL-2023a]